MARRPSVGALARALATTVTARRLVRRWRADSLGTGSGSSDALPVNAGASELPTAGSPGYSGPDEQVRAALGHRTAILTTAAPSNELGEPPSSPHLDRWRRQPLVARSKMSAVVDTMVVGPDIWHRALLALLRWRLRWWLSEAAQRGSPASSPLPRRAVDAGGRDAAAGPAELRAALELKSSECAQLAALNATLSRENEEMSARLAGAAERGFRGIWRAMLAHWIEARLSTCVRRWAVRRREGLRARLDRMDEVESSVCGAREEAEMLFEQASELERKLKKAEAARAEAKEELTAVEQAAADKLKQAAAETLRLKEQYEEASEALQAAQVELDQLRADSVEWERSERLAAEQQKQSRGQQRAQAQGIAQLEASVRRQARELEEKDERLMACDGLRNEVVMLRKQVAMLEAKQQSMLVKACDERKAHMAELQALQALVPPDRAAALPQEIAGHLADAQLVRSKRDVVALRKREQSLIKQTSDQEKATAGLKEDLASLNAQVARQGRVKQLCGMRMVRWALVQRSASRMTGLVAGSVAAWRGSVDATPPLERLRAQLAVKEKLVEQLRSEQARRDKQTRTELGKLQDQARNHHGQLQAARLHSALSEAESLSDAESPLSSPVVSAENAQLKAALEGRVRELNRSEGNRKREQLESGLRLLRVVLAQHGKDKIASCVAGWQAAQQLSASTSANISQIEIMLKQASARQEREAEQLEEKHAEARHKVTRLEARVSQLEESEKGMLDQLLEAHVTVAELQKDLDLTASQRVQVQSQLESSQFLEQMHAEEVASLEAEIARLQAREAWHIETARADEEMQQSMMEQLGPEQTYSAQSAHLASMMDAVAKLSQFESELLLEHAHCLAADQGCPDRREAVLHDLIAGGKHSSVDSLRAELDGRVSEKTLEGVKTGLVRAQLEGAVSTETQDNIKAGLVRTQLEGNEGTEVLADIKAGLVRSELDGVVGVETQDNIKAGLVRAQLESTVSDLLLMNIRESVTDRLGQSPKGEREVTKQDEQTSIADVNNWLQRPPPSF